MEKMRNEIKNFEKLEELEETSELTKDYLVQMKERYSKRRDVMKYKVGEISSKYERQQKQLKADDIFKSLQMLEDRLRDKEQTIFSLQEFIKTEGIRTDYESVKTKCFLIMNELNDKFLEMSQ